MVGSYNLLTVFYQLFSNYLNFFEADFASESKIKREMGKGDGVLAVLCFLLTAACGFDYGKRKIPNWLILLLLLHGLSFRIRQSGAGGIAEILGSAVVLVLLLYPLYKIGTLGAGDVKLFGVVAGYLPFGKIFSFLFISLLIAAVFSAVKMLQKRNFRERLSVFAGYIRTVADGGIQAYPASKADTVCLSGPVLLSLFLYLGGVY